MDWYEITALFSLVAAVGCLSLLVVYLRERGWHPGKEPLLPAAAVLAIALMGMNAAYQFRLRDLTVRADGMTEWAAWLHDHQLAIESLQGGMLGKAPPPPPMQQSK